MTDENASITHSSVLSNKGGGIVVENRATILDCLVVGNGGPSAAGGINGGHGVTINRATVSENQGDGIHLEGTPDLEMAGSIIDSVTVGNSGDGMDIRAAGMLITHCNASLNEEDGIVVNGGTIVLANESHKNNAAGVHATGSGNRIEANNVTANASGIDVDNAGNIIFKNTASGNTDNYGAIAPSNFVGTIITTDAAMNAAVNDLVNIEY